LERTLHIRQSARYAGLERLIVTSGAILGQRYGYDVGVLLWYSPRGLPRADELTLPHVHPMLAEATSHGLWAEQWFDRRKLAPGMVARLVKLIRERQVSLLHTHDHKSDFFGLMAARIAGVRIVATAHGYHEALWRIRLYRALDLLVLRAFDRVIAVSDAFRGELVAAGIPAGKVVTIHNAIDGRAFRLSAVEEGGVSRSRLDLSPDDRVVSIVGRLIPEKGHMDFLRAAERIVARVPAVRFLIAGEGRLGPDLEIAAGRMGLTDKVLFLGHRDDVATLMQLTEVVVFPSVREFFPNVLLEAAVVGRPVVATAVGGVPEIVTNGETGLLVPPRDPVALAEAVERMLCDPEWASAMGRRARARVEERFCLDRMVEATAGVYDAVLGEARGCRAGWEGS